MRLVTAVFSIALLSSVAFAGDKHARHTYLQGTGHITHADGSTDKYLVSMLIKKNNDKTKTIHCRYLGFDFDYMNEMRIVKHDNGTFSIVPVITAGDITAPKHEKNFDTNVLHKIGHGFTYKDDAFHMIMHMKSKKGSSVEVHFETEAGNPDNVIIRGMASKDHKMVHLWENRLSKIYSE